MAESLLASGAEGRFDDPALEDQYEQERRALLEPAQTGNAGVLLVLTLAAFILSELRSDGSLRKLGVLLGVLLFHELGHYAGMRLFGYRDVRMFFIPFFGAAVSGRREGVAAWKEAIVLLLERAKLVVEGAGAVGVAALLAGKAGGSGVAVPVLSGGNIDATMLISVVRHGLTSAGRYLVARTQLADRPGELIKLLSLVAEERGNLISVEHHREGMDIPVSETEVELTLVTRNEEHCRRLLAAMAERGYVVERLR